MVKKKRETKGKKNIILILFLLTAYFLPQGIFHIQDNILCSRTILSAREKIDVEALSTTYERSLPLRMLHFAECLEAGDNFYVTSKEMPITQEVYDYLYSGSLFRQGITIYFNDMGLLSSELIWEEGTVNQWKQYVIYSDDYTKGVNFILWYIELQDKEGEILKILADAETEVIYAMKEENSYSMRFWEIGDYDSQDGLSCYWHNGIKIWNVLAQYYDAITQEDIEEFLAEYGDMTDKELHELIKKMELEESRERYWLEYYFGYTFDKLWGNNPEGFSSEKNVLRFQLFYDETPFDVIIDMRDADIKSIPYYNYNEIYISPDITMGFRQIYELIPEFILRAD